MTIRQIASITACCLACSARAQEMGAGWDVSSGGDASWLSTFAERDGMASSHDSRRLVSLVEAAGVRCIGVIDTVTREAFTVALPESVAQGLVSFVAGSTDAQSGRIVLGSYGLSLPEGVPVALWELSEELKVQRVALAGNLPPVLNAYFQDAELLVLNAGGRITLLSAGERQDEPATVILAGLERVHQYGVVRDAASGDLLIAGRREEGAPRGIWRVSIRDGEWGEPSAASPFEALVLRRSLDASRTIAISASHGDLLREERVVNSFEAICWEETEISAADRFEVVGDRALMTLSRTGSMLLSPLFYGEALVIDTTGDDAGEVIAEVELEGVRQVAADATADGSWWCATDTGLYRVSAGGAECVLGW